MANVIDSLISNVRESKTLDALTDAYMAARRPCLDAGRMGDLLKAYEEAEEAIGPVACEPIADVNWG